MAEAMKARQTQADAMPKELAELEARLERLRERLTKGDPDMTADEIQAAIDRAEEKRCDLIQRQPAHRASARIINVLPRAAAECRKTFSQGLQGNPHQNEQARLVLREIFGGQVELKPGTDGSLWAEFTLHPAALLKGHAAGVGTGGSGGSIRSLTCVKPLD
jgi:hypothetical protein